jgi:hypothetical protein
VGNDVDWRAILNVRVVVGARGLSRRRDTTNRVSPLLVGEMDLMLIGLGRSKA